MGNTSEAATVAREQQQDINSAEATQPGDALLEPKPDFSDKSAEELLPQLMNQFNNSREELARALGLHRSTVDRWINGTSRPNNSTLLRMRRLAQERLVE